VINWGRKAKATKKKNWVEKRFAMKILFAGIVIGVLICCGFYYFESSAKADYEDEHPKGNSQWIQSPLETHIARTDNKFKNLPKYELKVATQINLLQARVLQLEVALKANKIALPEPNTPFEPILIYPMPGATYNIYSERVRSRPAHQEPNQ
jgi:hypothetical protein